MIRWFVRNGVAANLLMIIIVVGGIAAISNTVKLELFPEFDTDMVTVSVPYPGASPEEVEESIVRRIEERIQDIDGIKKITGSANEGAGIVYVEVARGHCVDDVRHWNHSPNSTQAPGPMVVETHTRRIKVPLTAAGRIPVR